MTEFLYLLMNNYFFNLAVTSIIIGFVLTFFGEVAFINKKISEVKKLEDELKIKIGEAKKEKQKELDEKIASFNSNKIDKKRLAITWLAITFVYFSLRIIFNLNKFI